MTVRCAARLRSMRIIPVDLRHTTIIVIISCLNRRTGSCRESHDTKEGLVLDAGANGCKYGSGFILTDGKV